jgi:flagellar basal-body rod protein FlgC
MMLDPLRAAATIAASGLHVQSMRMRVVAENMANAESTGTRPGQAPYVRKTISFSAALDQVTGAEIVSVADIGHDASPFRIEHLPGHPAADARGYVRLPNVNMIVEMTDMRQATRSYEANVQVIKQSNEMSASLIDLLRST